MRNTLIALAVLTAIVAIAGDQTRIYMEDAPKDSWVHSGQNERNMKTPTKLAKNELDLGVTSDGFPVRKPYGWRVLEEIVTPLPVTNETPEFVTNWVPVAWKYCKHEGNDVVAMIAQEKLDRDAWDQAEETAKEHAEQAAKPQYKKNTEKKAKDLLITLGLPVPVPRDSIIGMIDSLQAQVDALLADNKTKEAVAMMSNIDALTNLRISLGDDIYAPFLGDGGVDE